MSSNVRFTIHNEDENSQNENTRNTEDIENTDNNRDPGVIGSRTGNTVIIQGSNPTDVLFTMLNMATIIHPILSSIDLDIEYIDIDNDNDNTSNLQRQENIKLDVESELYSNNCKKWSECSICTETYKDTDIVSNLPCNHLFHTKCIKEWVCYSPTCPICKADIPVKE
jgi:hypothetical protein